MSPQCSTPNPDQAALHHPPSNATSPQSPDTDDILPPTPLDSGGGRAGSLVVEEGRPASPDAGDSVDGGGGGVEDEPTCPSESSPAMNSRVADWVHRSEFRDLDDQCLSIANYYMSRAVRDNVVRTEENHSVIHRGRSVSEKFRLMVEQKTDGMKRDEQQEKEASPRPPDPPPPPVYQPHEAKPVFQPHEIKTEVEDADGPKTAAAVGGRRRRNVIDHDSYKHILKKTELSPPEYLCLICKRQFKNRLNIRYHIACADSSAGHPCKECSRVFKSSSHLTYHLRTVHGAEKPYKCSFCEKAFAQSVKLKRHERTHTGEKPFKCDVCQNNFTTKYNLKEHMNIHKALKPYSCATCGAGFADKNNLRRHEATHISHKQECAICGFKADRKGDMIDHYKNEHPPGAGGTRPETQRIRTPSPRDRPVALTSEEPVIKQERFDDEGGRFEEDNYSRARRLPITSSDDYIRTSVSSIAAVAAAAFPPLSSHDNATSCPSLPLSVASASYAPPAGGSYSLVPSPVATTSCEKPSPGYHQLPSNEEIPFNANSTGLMPHLLPERPATSMDTPEVALNYVLNESKWTDDRQHHLHLQQQHEEVLRKSAPDSSSENLRRSAYDKIQTLLKQVEGEDINRVIEGLSSKERRVLIDILKWAGDRKKGKPYEPYVPTLPCAASDTFSDISTGSKKEFLRRYKRQVLGEGSSTASSASIVFPTNNSITALLDCKLDDLPGADGTDHAPSSSLEESSAGSSSHLAVQSLSSVQADYMQRNFDSIVRGLSDVIHERRPARNNAAMSAVSMAAGAQTTVVSGALLAQPAVAAAASGAGAARASSESAVVMATAKGLRKVTMFEEGEDE